MFRSLKGAVALAAMVAGTALVWTAPIAAAASKPIELHGPPAVDLPFGEDVTFPEGSGADVTSANCLTCHSADHTLNQPALSREEWSKVVGKMINAYKAPISPSDAKTIVDYLTRIKGEPEQAEKHRPQT